MRVKFFCILTFCLLLTSSVAVIAGEADVFRSASDAYEAGEFEKAIKLYTQIINDGVSGAELYYNTGNAYFKNGNLGLAILYYRRAQLLAPRDTEIIENLEYARALAIDEEKRVTDIRLGKMARNYLGMYSSNELALSASALFFVAMCFLCLSIYVNSEKATKLTRMVFVALLFCSIFIAGSLAYVVNEEKTSPPAIILAERVEVLAGPGPDFSAVFVLHEGAEVVVERSKNEWCKVRFPTVGSGWVHKDVIEKVRL